MKFYFLLWLLTATTFAQGGDTLYFMGSGNIKRVYPIKYTPSFYSFQLNVSAADVNFTLENGQD